MRCKVIQLESGVCHNSVSTVKLLEIEDEKFMAVYRLESSVQNNLLLNNDRGVPSKGGVKKLQTEAYIASSTV